MGPLCSSIKQVKAPYLLTGNRELLCTQCRVFGTHPEERGMTYIFFPVVAGTWGIFSRYGRDGPSKLVFVQQHQDSCLVLRETLGFSSRLNRGIGMHLKLRRENKDPIPVATGILGFLLIFKRSQASSIFEALNSKCLLSCQSDVRPHVEMRQGPRAFSRVYTGDSDIPSSCEMKDENAFK